MSMKYEHAHKLIMNISLDAVSSNDLIDGGGGVWPNKSMIMCVCIDTIITSLLREVFTFYFPPPPPPRI